MQIEFAHIQVQGINFAIFEADSNDKSNSGRASTLASLTSAARELGLRVERSALVYEEFGRISYFGTPDLVDYLANGRLPRMTHTLTI